jgi:hypothetical protein
MSLAGILVLAFVFVVLAFALGLALLARFLTSETAEDRAMRFDPLARPPLPHWFLKLYHGWRGRPRQLTYRRDRQGRFRKHRR